MKKLLRASLLLFLIVCFAQAQEWKQIDVFWNASVADGDSLITTGSDTSAVFDVVNSEVNQNLLYPETLTFTCWATELNSVDSTNCHFRLELSATEAFTYPVAVTPIDTLIASDGGTTVEAQIITNMPLLRYGRVIVTLVLPAGDTLSVGNELTADYSNY